MAGTPVFAAVFSKQTPFQRQLLSMRQSRLLVCSEQMPVKDCVAAVDGGGVSH